MQSSAAKIAEILHQHRCSVINAGFLDHIKVAPIALALTVGGWSLLWAEALGLVNWTPLWWPASMFYGGLTLIPLAFPKQPSAAAEASISKSPHLNKVPDPILPS